MTVAVCDGKLNCKPNSDEPLRKMSINLFDANFSFFVGP